MKIGRLFLKSGLLFLFFYNCGYGFGQAISPLAFQQKVQNVISQVSPACVKISPYDQSGKNRFGTFSGVLVTADGYLLTAAHATVTGEIYQVFLPDGRNYLGVALGRIPVVDAALIKIEADNATLPYCAMGWSKNLKVNQPCLSIAYPGSISELEKPVVRLGYVARTLTPEGKLQTTCLMEPGDSGGPVFNLSGQVVGLHSKIENSLKVNLENPVDNYRKYWKALIVPKDYPADVYPDAEQSGQIADQPSVTLPEIPFSQLLKSSKHNSTVGIKSVLGSVVMQAWGSIIALHNFPDNYVVSKSSIVGDNPVLTTNDLKSIAAVVIKRDPVNDLVLLKADRLPPGIELKKAQPDKLSIKEGAFLLSPSFIDSTRLGVLGSGLLKVEEQTRPTLGVLFTDSGHVVKIQGFTQGINQQLGLQAGDVVDSLNHTSVKSLTKAILIGSVMKPGDAITYSIMREDHRLYVRSLIQKMPKVYNKHIADTFEGGPSLRNEGFESVFVHDSMIRPEECGGPVFDLNGNFCGINIARVSRTSTIALPAYLIARFVSGALTGNTL